MFEKTKEKANEEVDEENVGYITDILTECEQETIKRLEWLRKKIDSFFDYDEFAGCKLFTEHTFDEIMELVDQVKNLPIEQIEEELK